MMKYQCQGIPEKASRGRDIHEVCVRGPEQQPALREDPVLFQPRTTGREGFRAYPLGFFKVHHPACRAAAMHHTPGALREG